MAGALLLRSDLLRQLVRFDHVALVEGQNKLASLDLIGRTMGGTGALEKMRLDAARLEKARAAQSGAVQ